jgi:hypothetical protein
MAKYKTAMGKVVDMTQLTAKNEHVRAVGNGSLNARGDTIDSSGKVVTPVTKKVGSAYQKTVSNRSANIVRNKQNPAQSPAKADIKKVVEAEEVTAEELEFLDTADEDAEIEAIKTKDAKKAK